MGSVAGTLHPGLILVAACTACTFETQVGAPPEVAANPSDPELVRFFGDLLQAAIANPDDAELRGLLAVAYEMNDFKDTALAVYQQAEALDSTDVRWPYFQATLVAGRGDLEPAIAHLDRALAIDAEYAPAWLWQGSFLRDLGRDDEAIDAFVRARQLGEAVHADVGLAQLALRQGRAADALDLLDRVKRANAHPQVFRLLGRAYQALGLTDEARIALARGKDATPLRWDDPRLAEKSRYIMSQGGLLALAEEAMRRKDYETAVRILAPLRVRFPDDKALLGNLAISYARTGQPRQAHDVLRHAFGLDAEHAPFQNAMATVLGETGDTAGAQHHLEESIRLNPAQAWAYERLGRIWMQKNEYDNALTAFESAVRYGIDKPETVFHLAGSIEGARERWPAAIAYFERAVALDESHAEAYLHLALCLAEVGRVDEAEAALVWAEKIGSRPREVAAARARLAGRTTPASVDPAAPSP